MPRPPRLTKIPELCAMRPGMFLLNAAACLALLSPLSADAAEVTVRFANVTAQASVEAAQVLIDVAKKESNGQLEIKHFPNNMLGDDRSVTESMMLGDIAMVQTTPTVLASLVPDLNVWEAPFLFDSIDEVWKCMDSPLGLYINNEVESRGIKYLATVENGFRIYTNNKTAVRVPKDIQGQRLRVMENDVQISMWKNWGAEPVPMPFTDVITALQQGTVDAQENPLSIIDANKLYEIQHYITITNHVFSPHLLLINKRIYESFDPQIKTAFDHAVAAYQAAQRKRSAELNALSADKFKRAGCEVTELTDQDREDWKSRALQGGIYDEIRSKMDHPEYLDKILNRDYSL